MSLGPIVSPCPHHCATRHRINVSLSRHIIPCCHVSPRVAWACRITLSTLSCHTSHHCFAISSHLTPSHCLVPSHPILLSHPVSTRVTLSRLGLSRHPIHAVAPRVVLMSRRLAVSSHVAPSHPITVSPGPRVVDVLPSRCHGIIPCHTLSPRVARACDIADPTLCHRVSVLSRRLKVSLMSLITNDS